MAVHIGEKIKSRAKELRVGPTELGRMINTSKQNIYGIYRRKSMDTEMLKKISEVLDCDFFQYYTVPSSKILQEDQGDYNSEVNRLKEELKNTKKELNELKEKYELIKKVNELLEKNYLLLSQKTAKK